MKSLVTFLKQSKTINFISFLAITLLFFTYSEAQTPCSITVPYGKLKHCLKVRWHKPESKWNSKGLLIDTYFDNNSNITAIILYSSDSTGRAIIGKRKPIPVESGCNVGKIGNVRNYYPLEKDCLPGKHRKLKKFTSMILTPYADNNVLRYHVKFNDLPTCTIMTAQGTINVAPPPNSYPCPDYCCPGPKCQ